MLKIILIKTRNAPIPTMKIRQIECQTGFLNSILWKCSLNPKVQAVNKVQRQLRPKPYFPEFFKSRALEKLLLRYYSFTILQLLTLHIFIFLLKQLGFKRTLVL